MIYGARNVEEKREKKNSSEFAFTLRPAIRSVSLYSAAAARTSAGIFLFPPEEAGAFLSCSFNRII